MSSWSTAVRSRSRKQIDLNPSHFGSYDAPFGIEATDLASIGETGGITGRSIDSLSWVVGLEEHLELNAVGVLECQHRTVFTLGNWRVGHAELFEAGQPLV